MVVGVHWAMAAATVMAAMVTSTANAREVRLYAAGSLKAAMGELTQAYAAIKTQTTFVTEFGASGLLRERIEKGEVAHVFASADTGHPKTLADTGKTEGPPTVFARNTLCALAKEGLSVTTDRLLDVLLDPAVRVGISTPKADPSGDYAIAMFDRAEAVKPGAKATLDVKAMRLTGGPDSAKAPEGQNLYAWVMSSGKTDVFLTYCTNAVLAKKDVPGLQIVTAPPALTVGADYGLVVLKGGPGAATKFAAFVQGPEGQTILAKYGFGPGDPAR
ncbi:MAG: molybdate ABC transporter substrate-binding protein [Hyphomicrobiaceae bacterium]|nr:molybdate ABC transporter substrate-binding protein [Hyphomicrobiaceae bacterium]